MSYLAGLNAAQREAVETVNGPLMVIAGAGSGKTRVITHRLAHLINTNGVAPESILAVTFTNKAAKEMKSRAVKLIGEAARNAWVSTFHSACIRILREHITRLGYGDEFVIVDDNDQRALVREILAGTNRDSSEADSYLRAISRFKNLLLNPDEALSQAVIHTEHDQAQVYAAYARRLRDINAVDFDDLLYLAVRLFQRHDAVRSFYQGQFTHIMVDEYQDTNHAQYTLISMLAAKHKNLCVVGDDGQSIYGFRMADITNILNFQQDYPNAKVIKLEQNYRSTQTILKAANAVISNNPNQLEKTLWTNNPLGQPIRFCLAPDDKQEAAFVVQEIQFMAREHSFSDIAILYRSNSQSRVLEEQLMRCRIPYRVVGGFKFYDRSEVRDTLAYLRLVANQGDNVSLLRVINTPKRGVGEKALSQLASYAAGNSLSLFQTAAIATKAGITGKTGAALEAFAAIITDLAVIMKESTVGDLMTAVFQRTGFRASFKESDKKDRERLENLDEFLTMARGFDGRSGRGMLKEFLDYIALMTDLDTVREGVDQVTLMTVHSSKGLEFPVVFITGMEDGMFPHHRALDENGLEEERRLFYVGITRARQQLYLSAAQERSRMGAQISCEPSEFLDEIPQECVRRLSFY